ncbi:hypothetical protein KC360_g7757 [Hortaea werneckii]|nr:hypothetical protein KC361_g1810 [Hortaea werneckii]KAI6879726.1 hypothetical protein KC325_g7766 [Hortaea werneckii]KAI6987813.1 hypothetical protein KC359_g8091 [Hortaea werneckii]KAI7141800.1 hypothetical protein KC344_g7727 [Hortaea werneckii]KAI7168961.1 hypothetical protein KC360_g7757 [Hortaea werneckii]
MAQQFPLMKLPPELRNCVYEAVVAGERIGIKKTQVTRPGSLFPRDVFDLQSFVSSSRIVLANKEVSCEYNSVLKRLVLDPKVTDIVIEECWLDMRTMSELEFSLQRCSLKYRCLIGSKLKLRVILTNSDFVTDALVEDQDSLLAWSKFCEAHDFTAEYELLGDRSTSPEVWEFLDREGKDHESLGVQIGREYAKVLRLLEDAANSQETSSPVRL